MLPRRSPGALLLLALTACATSGGAPQGSSLENTTWRLLDLGGTPAAGAEGERGARLQFLADSGRVAGSTGCNRLTGSYTRSGDALRFGPAATTRMACVDPRLNEQERVFLAALGSTERHRIAGDTLVLVGQAGPVARLLRVRTR